LKYRKHVYAAYCVNENCSINLQISSWHIFRTSINSQQSIVGFFYW